MKIAIYFRYYSVPGPVGSVSSMTDTTWAVVSWTIPSFIPKNYSIMTYEIGYHILQSNSCSMVETDSIHNTQMMIKQFNNVSAAYNYSVTILGLMNNTCYIFAVRAYTINGYSKWAITVEKTLPEIIQHSPSFSESKCCIPSIILSITLNTFSKHFIKWISNKCVKPFK